MTLQSCAHQPGSESQGNEFWVSSGRCSAGSGRGKTNSLIQSNSLHSNTAASTDNAVGEFWHPRGLLGLRKYVFPCTQGKSILGCWVNSDLHQLYSWCKSVWTQELRPGKELECWHVPLLPIPPTSLSQIPFLSVLSPPFSSPSTSCSAPSPPPTHCAYLPALASILWPLLYGAGHMLLVAAARPQGLVCHILWQLESVCSGSIRLN